jgi:hypothetical protein
MFLCVLAAEGIVPARISITADTGAENDRLCSNGRRMSAKQYYGEVVEPYCHENGIDSYFVRAEGKKGPLPPLGDYLLRAARANKLTSLKVPVFGSNGGRLKQSCTDRWKITAIKQQLRRVGATTARTAQGIHIGEASRRVRGRYIGPVGGFETYATTVKRSGVERVVKWLTHYYPLVDRRIRREQTREELSKRGIIYLESSECDFCPHQDWARWSRHTPESIALSAELEQAFAGEYFLTDRRIPLERALVQLENNATDLNLDLDFGCGNSFCGV